jgi:LAO/AO transport system kinase
MSLAAPVLEGNRLALSRLLTQIENNTPEGRAALGELFSYTGRAHLIGVTGAPGTGKSSLVNHLARFFRRPASLELQKERGPEPAPEDRPPARVAVVAVDPSSPFTGGAIMGDRVRMRDLAGDPGVFIRSMAARGSLGGLATTTAGLVQALDAAGFEIILIETVGAGQSEVDIARLAHTTLVVEAPGMGDDIQAIKAGILEIADLLVINKADRPGVENTERALRNMLQLAHPSRRDFAAEAGREGHAHHREAGLPEDNLPPPDPAFWIPPIYKTVAVEGSGITELGEGILRHREFLLSNNEWQRRERTRLKTELDELIREALVRRWRGSVKEQDYKNSLDALLRREISPYQAAERLVP